MRRIFIDAAFFVALLDDRDDLHDLAVLVLQELYAAGGVEFFTSDAVLAEVLTHFSRFTRVDRQAALEFVRRIRRQKKIRCIHVSTELFERALAHYESRVDKTYSFTDCTSMVICRDLRITEVLTHDHDFEQEGLRILL
ncbi:MAG: PIN domain-containing protein [Chloroflexi bacterium]|nr:PIN domain-containing protein [Chloroflexota bacterium]